MDKHNIAKNLLFCEIGLSVGIYEDISKVQKDVLNGKKNSGTHLFESIEQAWSVIAVNGDIKSSAGWDALLVSTYTESKTTLEISKIISSKFFGQASNEKLQMLVYDGVKNARRELIGGRLYK